MSQHPHPEKRTRLTALLSRLAFLLLPAALPAQAIEPGRWPATLHFADRDSALATFEVAQDGNRLLIDVTTATGNNWGMGDVRSDSTRLRFSWALDGPRPMLCNLSRRSAVYWEGHCDDPVRGNDGKFARMLVTLKREARSET